MAKNSKRNELITPVYNVIVIRNKITGGRYISVRKCTEHALRRKLEAGSVLDNPNSTEPVVRDIREHGPENFVYSIVATYDDKLEAQAHKAKLIEQHARKIGVLNAAIPRLNLPENDFFLMSEEETAEMMAAKAAKAKAPKAKAKKAVAA